MKTDSTETLLLCRDEVAELLGIGIRTILLWERRGKFPQPILLAGGRLKRWRMHDLRKWIELGAGDWCGDGTEAC